MNTNLSRLSYLFITAAILAFQTHFTPAVAADSPSGPGAVTNNSTGPSASLLDTITAQVQEVTNWVVFAGGGVALSGSSRTVVFGGVVFNFNQNIGVILAQDHLSGNSLSSWNTVRGGITLQAPGHLFSFTGVDFLSKISTILYAADCLAQPKSGDAIGNLVITGINADVVKLGKWNLGVDLAYEHRVGQGEFDGNYGLGMLTLRRPF